MYQDGLFSFDLKIRDPAHRHFSTNRQKDRGGFPRPDKVGRPYGESVTKASVIGGARVQGDHIIAHGKTESIPKRYLLPHGHGPGEAHSTG
jgi:hypothetical protein